MASSFEEQYEALRNGGGVVPLADWSSVAITGGDRQTFLNNFCTNDVKRLMPGTSCEALVTNVKGKILGHGLVVCRDDEVEFLGVPGQSARLIEHLDRYLIREDAQLQDTTAERSYALVAGGATALERFTKFLEDESASLNSPRRLSWKLIEADIVETLELDSQTAPLTFEALEQHGFVSVGTEAFAAARIEAGFPWFGVDFGDENLPQEVNRDQEAISFTKGCYLGQETVARIDALGHVNQRLVGVRFDGREVPESGAELSRNGKQVGRVTSAVLSPRLKMPLALAMVRREANAVGTRLDSAAGSCEVISLPVEEA